MTDDVGLRSASSGLEAQSRANVPVVIVAAVAAHLALPVSGCGTKSLPRATLVSCGRSDGSLMPVVPALPIPKRSSPSGL